MKKTILLFTLTFLATTIFSFATDDGSSEKSATDSDANVWNWGQNETETKGAWMYLTNSIDAKDFSTAAKQAHWLLLNSPHLNEALYIHAAKAYEGLEKMEKEPSRKKELQDSVLMIYDKRILEYGHEADVLNWKGRVAWKYEYKDKTKRDELYALYKRIDELNGDDMLATNIVNYMHAASEEKKAGIISEEDLLNLYMHLNEILDHKEASASSATALKAIDMSRERVEKDLLRNVTVDCEFVQTKLGPKFETAPDAKIANQISRLLITNKCISNDLFLSTSEFLLSEEATVERLTLTGKVYKKMDNMDSAFAKFEQAVVLEEDLAKKSDLLYDMAVMKKNKGLLNEARKLAYQSLEADAAATKNYTLIGDMYFSSYKTCSADDELTNRATYLAAYKMYSKAGNTTKMANAKAQFPSMEDIFLRGKKVGDEIKVSCWINETVKIDKRD